MAVRVTINQGAVNAMLRSPSGFVARDIMRRGHRVRTAAMPHIGVDTGRLRSSVTVELVMRGGVPCSKIGSKVNYARPHHDGHGWIYPKKPGGVLVFKPKGSATVVFATKVRPVAGTHFLTKGLPAARG
jgi:hypothetical protein